MQKTKIAAEELAEMIRDGLAEEGHDVQVQPILKQKPSQPGFANSTTWRGNSVNSVRAA